MMKILFPKYGLIIILILTGFLLPAQTTQQQLEQKRKKLEEEIEYTNKLIRQTQKTKKNYLYELNLLNSKISKRQELVATVKSELYELEGSIEKTEKELSYLDKELLDLKQEYARLAYFVFKHNNAYDKLIFLFSAEDLNQAYQRLRYLEQLSEFIRSQAENIKQLEDKKGETLADLKRQNQEKRDLLEKENLQLSKLEVEQINKDKLKNKLAKKEKDLRASLRAKEREANKLNKKIKEIIAKATKPKPAKGGGKSYTLTPEEKQLSSSFSANKGRLPWPVDRGVVSETYGIHQHPVLKKVKTKNNGVTIATAQNGEARCVFDGVVVSVSTISATNKAVIVKHGEYFTVYSNLDKVYVSKGDKVTTKETIGRIHTTLDGQTELQFQVWKGKTILNPSYWIKGK
jgi:septal ring factor EnvC (AmiA/AmiB activator)